MAPPESIRQKKRRCRNTAFSDLRTLEVGLLVPSSWSFSGPPASRPVSRFQSRSCSCIGLPWHSAIGSFRVPRRVPAPPSVSSRSPLSQPVLPSRPPPPVLIEPRCSEAGRLSTSELAGAEAFASRSILLSNREIAKCFFCNQVRGKSTCRSFGNFRYKVKVK